MDSEVENLLSRMTEVALKKAGSNGDFRTEVPGVSLHVRAPGHHSGNCVARASIGLILSGRKEARIGGRQLSYGRGETLVICADAPDTFTVLPAELHGRFVCMSLALDPDEVMEVASRIRMNKNDSSVMTSAFIVLEKQKSILNCFERLFELLANPDDVEFLGPMIKKELIYRVLTSPEGAGIAKLFLKDSKENRIHRSMVVLRQNFDGRFNINELAKSANMSPSSFYRYFKDVAGVSPLQFLKEVRLVEARRLMQEENKSVSMACFSVGYESQTQFSREYKRYFGNPPSQDLKTGRGENLLTA